MPKLKVLLLTLADKHYDYDRAVHAMHYNALSAGFCLPLLPIFNVNFCCFASGFLTLTSYSIDNH